MLPLRLTDRWWTCLPTAGLVYRPLKNSGSKVYVEIRLSDQIRRFTPVEVGSVSGEFSYDGLGGVQFNVRTRRCTCQDGG